MSSQPYEERLEELFRAYKEACPDPEASANFMPLLWEKIEAQQQMPRLLKRFTQVFVSAAALLCLVMSALLFAPTPPAPIAQTYVEALDTAQPPESLAYADIVPISNGESQWQ